MYSLRFLRNFLTQPGVVGAVAPSSRKLAQAVVTATHTSLADVVVEFGPGTGAITSVVLEHLQPTATFLAMEINADFVNVLHKRFPQVTVCHDSAVNTGAHLREMGLDGCDAIVSGLPWTIFPYSLQDELLDTVERVLRPGGRFATYMYLNGMVLPSGLRFRANLIRRFGRFVERRTVWPNIPPAQVLCVEKPRHTPDGGQGGVQ